MSAFKLIREKQRVGPEVHLTVTENTLSRSLRWSQLSTFTGGWPLKSCLWVHQRIVHYTEKICIRCFNKWQFFMYMHSEDMFYRCIQIRLGSVDIKIFLLISSCLHTVKLEIWDECRRISVARLFRILV